MAWYASSSSRVMCLTVSAFGQVVPLLGLIVEGRLGGCHRLKRITAQQQVGRWGGNVQQAEERMTGLGGITRLVAVICVPCRTDRIDEGIVVGDGACSSHHGTSRPVGAKGTRLNGGDINSK